MKNVQKKPPRLAGWLLRRIIRSNDYDYAMGDLYETYACYARDRGARKAWCWFWGQVMVSAPRFLKNILYWRLMMFKNYLKIALRNIRMSKVYSVINIAGLAVGMTCCLFILLWVHHETSFDKFHANRDRLFRVLQHIKYSEVVTWAITQGPLGPALKEEVPEIQEVSRYVNASWRIKYKDQAFERRGGYVDSSFLTLFSFPLVRGNPETALTDPYAAVITEELAVSIFGSEDPVGKVINLSDQYDIQITGVLKNIPENSHLQFDFLGTMAFAREIGYTVDIWTNSTFSTYVLLSENLSPEIVEEKIYDFLDSKLTLEEWEKLTLQPLMKIHFSTGIGYDNTLKTNPQYVIIFFVAAVFILLIACINFMNLATARSTLRAKEVGLRKVAGAVRGQLIHQFLGESVFLAIVSFVVAMGLVYLLLPVFNQLSGKHFSVADFGSLDMLLGVFLIVLLTGILSGSYPAFILSAFLPVKVIKGSTSVRTRKSLFRRALVVFQFSISIILLIGTFVIYTQIRFMQNQDIGYNSENLVSLYIPRQVRQQYDGFKNEVLKNPHILKISRSMSQAEYGITFTNGLWNWEGKNPEEDILFRANLVGYDFFDTFGMKMVAGRPFSKMHATDSMAIIINEKALDVMGLQDPIGKRVNYGRTPDQYTPFHIVGVVKDFNFLPLHAEIEPLIVLLSGGVFGFANPGFVYLRISSDSVDETLVFIEKTWATYFPGYDFTYQFVDDSFKHLYGTEERIGNILKSFTVLAVLVSSLGLFGLASFMATRRTKEIGVRKVLGASVSGIVAMLIKEFSKWIIVANLISWPVAYFAMSRWLQNFAYRTGIHAWIFLATGVVTLTIAMLTVTYQALKAAWTNPTEALRYE